MTAGWTCGRCRAPVAGRYSTCEKCGLGPVSASTAPDGEEVERVARALNPRAWEVMDHELRKTQEKYAGQKVSWPVSQFQHKESMDQARAAISAMRPTETHVRGMTAGGVEFEKYAPLESVRPTLSPEDRARVKWIREHLKLTSDEGARRDIPFLLFLIDKLTEAG